MFHKEPMTAVSTIIVVIILVVFAGGVIVGIFIGISINQKPSSPTTSQAVSITSVSLTTTFSIYSGSSATETSSGSFEIPQTLPSETFVISGSTLLNSLFSEWAKNFTQIYPAVSISISNGLGQQGQLRPFVAWQIYSSDLYLSNEVQELYPYALDIPLVVSAEAVIYNIPGLPPTIHLNFTGTILAQIYNGSVAYWDNPQIEALNPGAAQYLTHNPISPIRRADGSGGTFLFTVYLSKTDPIWAEQVGNGTTISWPVVSSEQPTNGDGGMLQSCDDTNYSIGYIAIPYLSSAVKESLGYAYLQNAAGNFVNISVTTIESELTGFSSQIPASERISLVDGSGSFSYPLVNFEYTLVSKNYTNSSMALDIRTFLEWAIDPNQGSSLYYLTPLNFIALPQNVFQLSMNQIEEISP